MIESGIKESKDKLIYEIDWEFIEGMAVRMSENKGEKYPIFNWKKPIEYKELLHALTRHFIEIQKENYDDEQELGHFYAIACNAMMITYQLKNFRK